MSATVPWNPIQLWKRHRVATIAGFTPALLVLAPSAVEILDAPLPVTVVAIVSLSWGLTLAHFLAGRRWIVASLIAAVPVLVLAVLFSLRPAASLGDGGDLVGARRPDDDGPQTGAGTDPTGPLPKPGGRPPIPPDLEPFRQYSKQLVNGVVGFDYPPKMKVGDHTDVNLRVSVQKAVQELRELLTQEGREPIVEPATLSSRMRADLRGFGFEVTPLSSPEQLIDADEDTTWKWDVRATESGKQRLIVTLTAIIEMEGTEGARDVSTFYREVEVAAIPKTWWESTRDIAREYGPSRDVLWPAIPTAIAAVWAFLFARKRSRQKRSRRR